jgi:hypothetical protein
MTPRRVGIFRVRGTILHDMALLPPWIPYALTRDGIICKKKRKRKETTTLRIRDF